MLEKRLKKSIEAMEAKIDQDSDFRLAKVKPSFG